MGEERQPKGVFRAVLKAYAEAGDRPLCNGDLYRSVSSQLGLSLGDFSDAAKEGDRTKRRSPSARAARWTQQTMKSRGWIAREGGRRGVWKLTPTGKSKLNIVPRGKVLVAFHTRLGLALWGDARDVYSGLAEPISLVLTSPPYPLAKPRDYGNPPLHEYVDFLTRAMEPMVKALAPGGSICLNLCQDIYVPNSPARSLYLERLIIALHDKLGLSLMDRHVWKNPCRPPAPVQWSSIHRVQLLHAWDPIYWFTNCPDKVRSNNQRVLEPHRDAHLKFLAVEDRAARTYCDGAYRTRETSYKNITAGRIPRNVRELSHNCASQRRYKAQARSLGLPVHGAPFPKALAEFYIRFLTTEGELCVDPMAGSLTVAEAAENLGRRWIVSDVVAEYLRGGATRFNQEEIWINPSLDRLLGIPPQPDRQQQLFGQEGSH